MSKQLKKKKSKNKKRKDVKIEKNNKIVVEKVEEKEETKVEEKVKKEFIKDNFGWNLFVVTIITYLIEIIFRIINNFEIISYASLRILLSTFVLSFVITFISSLFKWRWVRNTINIIYVFGCAAYSWLQLGFMNFLGVYISFYTSGQAAAVVDYIGDFVKSFKLIYLLVFIPVLMLMIFYVIILDKEYKKIKMNFKKLLIIPILGIVMGLYYLTLTVPFMQNEYQFKSNIKLFVHPDIPTIAVNQFGTSTFGLIDLKSFFFPVEEELEFNIEYKKEEKNVSREVTNLLDYLALTETNKKYGTLNKFFASQSVTDYNDYTGMFKGKNVIFVMLESGSYGFINEKYYPNFYKLYNNGWYFQNYYSPRNSCATGNNEFSALTGLYSIYNTCTTNGYMNSSYYESLFGVFNDNGYKTTSMHNFTEWYYYRSVSHKNMGATYYGANELNIKTGKYGEWPSDIELMEKAFDIILEDKDDKPWMTWIMTVTAHQPYSSASTYGNLYMKYFKEEGYSTNVARYMSKLKTVDDALGYMLKTLEKKKELDNTLIIMMPDHYPYGLNENEIKEMYDTYFEDYEKEKVPLVMYNTKMEHKVISDYTSYVDLLPTVANLIDLNFDPRLYMGTDLFSEDHESLVVFPDGSWKNEYAYYNASTSKLIEYEPGHYNSEDIIRITNESSLKISMSTLAIKNDYFKYLKDKNTEYSSEDEE